MHENTRAAPGRLFPGIDWSLSGATSKRSRTALSRPAVVADASTPPGAAPMVAHQLGRLSPLSRPRPAARTQHFDPDPYDMDHDVDMDPPARLTQPHTDIDVDIDPLDISLQHIYLYDRDHDAIMDPPVRLTQPHTGIDLDYDISSD